MGLDDCPLCYCGYHHLSQHLRVLHKVINKEERQLLLALSSGRVNIRKGACPVSACGKVCSRLDHHLKSHTELTKEAQREAMKATNTALHNMTRRYHLLQRRSQATLSVQVACVTSTLLSVLGSTEEKKLTAEAEHPTIFRSVPARKATKRHSAHPPQQSVNLPTANKPVEGAGTTRSPIWSVGNHLLD
ncbi:hypothetical protein QQF64_018538 [Cirrhinus molitorella]|uniref:C2H2-type domain-containing protein n=1 Tax=Cirrhinus molitorella TaxID=172907 RepID=A0ABR3LCV8_9TELE